MDEYISQIDIVASCMIIGCSAVYFLKLKVYLLIVLGGEQEMGRE